MVQHFAQLSDPHLSSLSNVRARDLLNKRALGYLSWRRKRRFEHRPEVLAALQRDLQGKALDQLLVTGDLTHIGLPEEFQQGADWLHALGTPTDVALVPGNHDACVAAPWQDTFAKWQDYMTSDSDLTPATERPAFPSLRVRGDIAFIGLSTGCPKPPLMATGTLGEAQLSKLPALLQDAAAQGLFRVVYLHHCPVVGVEKWRKRLTDAPQVQALLEEYGAELVLHGHGHRAHFNEIHSRQGTVPVIAVPSASALGLHGADVAQYNLYRTERNDTGWELRVESRRYQPEVGEFAEGYDRTLQLDRSWS
ncbi:3',5'-cyclic adenosine monophosphate phosphodiesterase CpdA [Halioglobus japonicus]|nr:3',5'-cyclic adenosine monophosphate phosphodiesterase CpdA [Halioglobus japonicus]